MIRYILLIPLINFAIVAGEIKVVAASDLTYALKELKQQYIATHPNKKISLSLGSSGKAYTQILHGAPYDIYFSADIGYVHRLYKQGFTIDKPKVYAYGRIGVWLPKSVGIATNRGLDTLLDPKIKKISIANPKHAPYGRAALEALKSRGVYNKIKDKLILGENVSQAVQFAMSGASDAVVAPLSLASSSQMKSSGSFYLFPSNWHKPIIQGYALLKRAKDNSLAKSFEEFINSAEARKIFEKYGFKIPGE